MMYYLSFISIMGWIFFLSLKYKKYSSFFPVFVITSIIAILYIGGLAGALFLTSRLIFFIGILLPLYVFLRLRPSIEDLRNLPVSFLILLITGTAWFFFTRSATIFGWDEFAWGQFTKVIFNTNGLYTMNSAIMDGKLNYPPGISLFQYFFLPFNRYSEAAIYFAQGIVVLCAISLIFDLIGKNWKRLIIFGLAVGSTLVYFGPGLLSMTNDHIVGSIFGGAILSIIILRSNKSKLLLIPVIFSLPLIKITSIILALTILFVVLADSLIVSLNSKQEKNTIRKLLKPIFLFLILSFFALASMKSWDFYLKSQGMPNATTYPNSSKIKKSFSKEATEREKITLRNFNKALMDLPLNQQEGEIKANIATYNIYSKMIKKINRSSLSILEWLLVLSNPIFW